MKKTGTLFSAIAMLGISIVALTTASFAWFSASSTATVDGMHMTAQGGSRLLISEAVGGEYKSEITLNSNNSLGAIMPEIMDMATPANGQGVKITDSKLTFKRLQDASKFSDASKPSANEYVAAIDGTWFEKDFYIKAGSIPQGQKLVVSLDTTTVVTDKESGQASKAMRIAFVTDWVETNGTVHTGTTAAAKVYEPNKTALAPTPTGEMAKPSFHDTERLASTVNPVDNKIELFTLNRSTTADAEGNYGSAEIYRVRVYVWIEGNDVDCVDEIINDKFDVSLNFYGAAVDIA